MGSRASLTTSMNLRLRILLAKHSSSLRRLEVGCRLSHVLTLSFLPELGYWCIPLDKQGTKYQHDCRRTQRRVNDLVRYLWFLQKRYVEPETTDADKEFISDEMCKVFEAMTNIRGSSMYFKRGAPDVMMIAEAMGYSGWKRPRLIDTSLVQQHNIKSIDALHVVMAFDAAREHVEFRLSPPPPPPPSGPLPRSIFGLYSRR